MDFFASQDQARRRTGTLLSYFVLAVILIVLAVYGAFWLVFAYLAGKTAALPGLWQPQLFLGVMTGTCLLIAGGALYKLFELRAGGEAIAGMLGGRRIVPGSGTGGERRLLNVVEEMALAAGVPVPPVYLLDEEDGINAFAAGYSSSNAVIGVTRGAVERLTRDELQGVIAHEYSHILNGDMRLNIRLVAVLNGILLIALIGQGILRGLGRVRTTGRSGKKGGGGIIFIVVLALLLLVIGYVGVFFAKLIQSAISRQREYLADASAVQFTRNPDGLAGALKKIGASAFGSRVQHENAAAVNHMFFENGMKPAWFGFMATHPPLIERIRRLDPAFDGNFRTRGASQSVAGSDDGAARDQQPLAASAALRAAKLPVLGVAGSGVAGSSRIRPDTVLSRIGTPLPEHLAYAASVRAAIPEELRQAAGDPGSAPALIYGLLLDPATELRSRQAAMIPADLRAKAEFLGDQVRELAPRFRLPVADLATPALLQMPAAEIDTFRTTLQKLVSADNEITLYEYALQRALLGRLEARGNARQAGRVAFYSFGPVLDECEVLLSTLAYAGAGDAATAATAYAQACGHLQCTAGARGIRKPAECGLEAVDNALKQLVQLAPARKRQLVQACAYCVAFDGRIALEEAELLRAVAGALDCPMPPFLSEELAA